MVTSWPRARSPRASVYVLQPLPPQTGGKESVGIRIRIGSVIAPAVGEALCRPGRTFEDGGLERAAVRLPTVLAERAFARRRAEPGAQRRVLQRDDRIRQPVRLSRVVEHTFPLVLNQRPD